MSTQDIYRVIYDTIHGAAIYHFNIIAIVGDGAQANSRFQKRHFVNEIKYIKGTKYNNCMLHPAINMEKNMVLSTAS